MARLFQLSYSPWSEKARWALEHHRVAYDSIDHVPMLGEPRLWLAVGKLGGRVSVPLFVDRDVVLRDSLDIARHADRVGSGTPLLPAGSEGDVASWAAASDALGAAGRVLVIARTLSNRDAQREALPRGMPGFLAPAAAMGAAFIGRKYGVADDEVAAVAKMRAVLDDVRAALGGRDYLLDRFTFADVAIAACMQVVSPVADAHLRLGPATRRIWTSEALTHDFGDLLAWRDAIYERHRRPADYQR